MDLKDDTFVQLDGWDPETIRPSMDSGTRTVAGGRRCFEIRYYFNKNIRATTAATAANRLAKEFLANLEEAKTLLHTAVSQNCERK